MILDVPYGAVLSPSLMLTKTHLATDLTCYYIDIYNDIYITFTN